MKKINKKTDPRRLIETLKRQKRDFMVSLGNYSCDIVFYENGKEEKIIFRQNYLSENALKLAGAIKGRTKSFDKFDSVEKENIRYFEFFQKKTGIYKNVIEIDLNSAYWILALKMGLLSEPLYNAGLRLSKKERLIVLGSIATTKKIMYFKGGEFETDFTKYSKSGKAIFYNIALRLSEIMSDIVNSIGREFFYLYWVDAFFCSKSVEDAVKFEIEKRGFEFKTINIDQVTVKNTGKNNLKVFIMERLNTYSDSCTIEIRPFQYNSNESQKETYFKIYQELKIIK